MMSGLVFVCALLVVESSALPNSAPIPSHPSQDLIDEAEQLTNSRIISGEQATISNNPWQVSLRSMGSHICGGVILNSTAILTAAHCLGSSYTPYSVRYGSGSRISGGGISAATGMKINGRYQIGSGGFPNDIAILMVKEMSLGSNAAAIPLNSRSNNVLAGLGSGSCRITGWGRTSGSSSSLPTILQGTNVNVLTDSSCGSIWGNNLNAPLHICVSGDGSGACNGDSGGPLVCENDAGDMELVGVTSWGASGCSTSYPSVYTEVSYYQNFVLYSDTSY
ncbi:trypsin beta-like [Argopecten irradians]|uniref:trypsin beta-like n=1 Tax=Argopecten irradians TaxID=31199 RepID=UPI0037124141